MDIKGKVAIVTGGASGLGKATARAIVERGGKVAIIDIKEEQGREVERELGTDNALFVKTDVTSEEEVKNAISETVKKFGAIHIDVNCAGTGIAMKTISKAGPHDLQSFLFIININLVGTFNVARLSAYEMSKNDPLTEDGERGVIINTASVAAFDGQIGQVAYSASKGGIVGMTLPMARDLARYGIRVVTIAPGTFDTPLLGMLPEEVKKALAAQIPFPQRLGKPEEYAALALHIVENSMLNGEVIRLDGALRMPPK